MFFCRILPTGYGNPVILVPDQHRARIKSLYNRKICIGIILALFVGIVIIWINSRNIPDKELVTGLRDVRRGQIDRSTGDAQTIPQALIGNNASTEAHRPSLFGDFEKMAGDD